MPEHSKIVRAPDRKTAIERFHAQIGGAKIIRAAKLKTARCSDCYLIVYHFVA